jgi:hypothetical protein
MLSLLGGSGERGEFCATSRVLTARSGIAGHLALLSQVPPTNQHYASTWSLPRRPVSSAPHKKLNQKAGRMNLRKLQATGLQSKGAHTSDNSVVRSKSDGSSFSGLFTRVEIGHMVIGSEGQVMRRSRGSGSALSQQL